MQDTTTAIAIIDNEIDFLVKQRALIDDRLMALYSKKREVQKSDATNREEEQSEEQTPVVPTEFNYRTTRAILGFFQLNIRRYEDSKHYSCRTPKTEKFQGIDERLSNSAYDTSALLEYLNEETNCRGLNYDPEMVIKLFQGALNKSDYPHDLYSDWCKYEIKQEGSFPRHTEPEAMLRRLMMECTDHYPILRDYKLPDIKAMCDAAKINVEGNLRKRDTWVKALCAFIHNNRVDIPIKYF